MIKLSGGFFIMSAYVWYFQWLICLQILWLIIFTFSPIFFNSIQCGLKKSSVCNIKCLFWACSFLMRTLSVLIEAQTRLSIKIHRRNFHVSTDPQWVHKIFELEYKIFIRCLLKLHKLIVQNLRRCIGNVFFELINATCQLKFIGVIFIRRFLDLLKKRNRVWF